MVPVISSPLFSIIIPVYNVKGYIEKSVEAVLTQSFGDFELLLVNDGSTDGSGEYIDCVAKRERRVHTFHQPNSGVSAARNLGLENARGKWILFVDGDDALKPDALQILAECIAENPHVDLIGYGFESVATIDDLLLEAGREYNKMIVDGSDTVGMKALDHYMVWGEAFRKDLLEGLRFKPLKNGEDVLFCNAAACRSNCYMEVDAKLYLYLQRGVSARANAWTERRFEDYSQMHEGILCNLLTCNKRIDSVWLRRWAGSLLLYIPQLWEQTEVVQKHFFASHRSLLRRVKKLDALPGYLKIWIAVATSINSRAFYRMTAMKPMNLYSQIVNH